VAIVPSEIATAPPGGPMTDLPAVTPQQMRTALGTFCSGITVVTAMDHHQPIGFTCQSFSSLSLDPPLVSFSPSRTSTTWPRIRSAGSFAVNVLSAEQDAISNGFARPGSDKFRDVKWTPSRLRSPLIDGAVAWAECRIWAEYDGGDHTIVAAEVLDLQANLAGRPLLYFRGEYGHLAQHHQVNGRTQ